MGAIAAGGVRVLNDETVRALRISEHVIEAEEGAFHIPEFNVLRFLRSSQPYRISRRIVKSDLNFKLRSIRCRKYRYESLAASDPSF